MIWPIYNAWKGRKWGKQSLVPSPAFIARKYSYIHSGVMSSSQPSKGKWVRISQYDHQHLHFSRQAQQCVGVKVSIDLVDQRDFNNFSPFLDKAHACIKKLSILPDTLHPVQPNDNQSVSIAYPLCKKPSAHKIQVFCWHREGWETRGNSRQFREFDKVLKRLRIVLKHLFGLGAAFAFGLACAYEYY